MEHEFQCSYNCKKSAPLLTELLTSKIEPQYFVFKRSYKRLKTGDANDYYPSKNLSDYWEANAVDSDLNEKLGSDNSLFLAVAKTLVYKKNFKTKDYSLNMFFIKINKLNSENRIQRLLRIKLCSLWLESIEKSNFSSKYLM